MPHDSKGRLLKAGDRVILRGVVDQVDDADGAACNITMRADRALYAEHDAVGYDVPLNSRMVELEGVRPEWQERVLAEAGEVRERVERLERFLGEPPPDLDRTQHSLLEGQLRHMRAYLSVLEQRIETFSQAGRG